MVLSNNKKKEDYDNSHIRRLEDQDSICEDFAKRHNLLLTGLFQREKPAIYWTIRAKLAVDSALSSKDEALNNEPSWGLLLSMLDKTFEHVEGSIIAFITGSPASSEVIARTIVESAINIMYILDNDPNNCLIQYFLSYINQERRDIRLWSELTNKMNENDSKIHHLHINQKEQALNRLEIFINDCKKQIGSNNNKNRCEWPNIFRRFEMLGFEIDYRTLYAAMCSQTHNDAEDILNYFFFVASGNRELLEQCAIETVNFSRLLMYGGIDYYLEAARRYAICFKLDDAIPILNQSKDDILKLLLEIVVEKRRISNFI